jgi:hypothetical protein
MVWLVGLRLRDWSVVQEEGGRDKRERERECVCVCECVCVRDVSWTAVPCEHECREKGSRQDAHAREKEKET